MLETGRKTIFSFSFLEVLYGTFRLEDMYGSDTCWSRLKDSFQSHQGDDVYIRVCYLNAMREHLSQKTLQI